MYVGHLGFFIIEILQLPWHSILVMLYPIVSYFRFLQKATNHHGIHSPFVFQFVTQCLYDKESKSYYNDLKRYRQRLLASKEVITVSDFGAGSRVFNSNTRAVAAIARHAGASFKRTKLLARCVAYFRPTSVLELGTSLGIASVALASQDNTLVQSIEGCPATAEIARRYFTEFEIRNVELVIGQFGESLPKLTKNNYDLIYFDGNHSKEATLNYVAMLLPTITNDTVWLFDDIHWSEEMTAAWEEIKALEQVRVTVDCFWLGFVFFRKEQVKEHFKVRL